MRFTSLRFAALIVLSARSLAAQAPVPLAEVQPGARVRVDAPGIVAGRYVGTVLTRNDDTFTIGNPTGPPISVPLARIRSLEISRGKSRADGAIRGMLWGAPIGAVSGAFAGAFSDSCETCADKTSTGEAILLFTASGVLWGAGIGAIVGRERWERFDLPVRTSLRFDRRAVSLAFVVPR
jgi:hypothetical protein